MGARWVYCGSHLVRIMLLSRWLIFTCHFCNEQSQLSQHLSWPFSLHPPPQPCLAPSVGTIVASTYAKGGYCTHSRVTTDAVVGMPRIFPLTEGAQNRLYIIRVVTMHLRLLPVRFLRPQLHIGAESHYRMI